MIRADTNSQSGFTLLEILVALAILAVASAGLIKATGQNVSNLQYMENKLFATWVAENKLNELRIKKSWPKIGSSTELITMANRRWDLSIKVSPTTNSNLRRVKIDVRDNLSDMDQDKIAVLSGFIGRN